MRNVSTIPRRLEASGVELTPDGSMMYIIFDNTFLIGAFCNSLWNHTRSCRNRLLKWPVNIPNKVNSEFEGIAYNPSSDTYFVIQETVPSTQQREFNSNVFEIRIDPDKDTIPIELIESCRVVWTFSSSGKGFEGLEFMLHQQTNKSYLLALCEGNDCKPKPGSGQNTNIGQGRIVVLEKYPMTEQGQHCL